jgi:hypothetical protein
LVVHHLKKQSKSIKEALKGWFVNKTGSEKYLVLAFIHAGEKVSLPRLFNV